MACNASDKTKNFKWPEVRTTVEFKRTKNDVQPPPNAAYEAKEYDPPAQQYMDLRKEMKEMQEEQEKQATQNPVEPPSSTHVHTATSTSKTSNDCKS